MSSPQSPADFLPAVRDKSQQLEEELTNHREVPAGGTTKHQHQLGPEQGTHDTNIRDTNQNHNPSPSCLISTGFSFSFLFSVIPQVQYFFILFDLVLIYVLLLLLQRMAALTGKPITWEKVQVPTETTRHRGPDPPTTHRPTQDSGREPVTCSSQWESFAESGA